MSETSGDEGPVQDALRSDEISIPSFLTKPRRESVEPTPGLFAKAIGKLFRKSPTLTQPETWEPLSMKRVIVESPYAGDIVRNVEYAKECCLDCVKRGEVPFASHLFFTQFLDDTNSDHRTIGMHMGYDFWDKAEEIIFYVDLGLSPGMERALAKAFMENKPVKKRSIKSVVAAPAEIQKFAPKRGSPFSQLEADIKDAVKSDAKDINV